MVIYMFIYSTTTPKSLDIAFRAVPTIGAGWNVFWIHWAHHYQANCGCSQWVCECGLKIRTIMLHTQILTIAATLEQKSWVWPCKLYLCNFAPMCDSNWHLTNIVGDILNECSKFRGYLNFVVKYTTLCCCIVLSCENVHCLVFLCWTGGSCSYNIYKGDAWAAPLKYR